MFYICVLLLHLLGKSCTITTMTLPDERYRAVLQTADFLLQIAAHPKLYPGVPRKVREEARALLRHFPTYYDLKQMERACPELFQERMDDLHKFIVRGQQQD
jgi:hypothetical protein